MRFMIVSAYQMKMFFLIVVDVLYRYFGNSATVIVPEGIKTISCYCFSGDNIKIITLPDSVCKIEESAFFICRNLHTLFIHNHEIEIDDSIFDGCSSTVARTI